MLINKRGEIDRYIYPGLALSLLLHIWLVLAMHGAHLGTSVAPQIMEVSLVTLPEQAPPPAVKQQIVAPPQQDSAIPPVNPGPKKYLSDRDTVAKREQVKRGDAPDAAPALSTQRAAKQSPPNLSLDAKTLLEKFGNQRDSPPMPQKQTLDQLERGPGALRTAPNYRAFSRPPGSGAARLGITGSADYLPNLPDGDITMLNAKASRFAVFVQRVATQVFGQLRTQGWDNLLFSDIQRISGFSTVIAVMSPQGKLLSVTVETQSGSERFDQVVYRSAQNGARDPNPPAEAAAPDGNIHFIFRAKSWSRYGADPRNGAPSEQRWLLLATGLD
ncbi:MAG: TonB family protein [Oligoflexia bacterium]|nr:TonB family protein [Oligoflexia bacterium]